MQLLLLRHEPPTMACVSRFCGMRAFLLFGITVRTRSVRGFHIIQEEKNMQIRVCVAGRVDGNKNGLSRGEWISLPMPVNELEEVMRRIGASPADRIITDWEAPFWIESDTDVWWINETAYTLAEYDNRLVYALCGCIDNMDMLLTVLKTSRYNVYYDVQSLHDVAKMLIRSGYYGHVPAPIRKYIDMDKLVRDMEDRGWHMQHEVNTAVQLLG